MKQRLVALVLALGAISHGASAQPWTLPIRRRPTQAPAATPAPMVSTSLVNHVGLAVAERLLASESSDDRVRGVERLASLGQREGVDRIVRALIPEAPSREI